MNELLTIITVIGMFILRIGIPVITLIIVGILIEHWQTGQNNGIGDHANRNHYA